MATFGILAVAGMLWNANRTPRGVILPDLKLTQLTINSPENLVSGGLISPDGKYLAYADEKRIHIKVIGADEVQTVHQPESLKDHPVKWEIAAWFPDSVKFVVTAHPADETLYDWSSDTASIWVVSVLGGAPSRLRDHAVAYAVSPDGSSIAFGTNNGRLDERQIWLMATNGEQARKLYVASENNGICCLYFFPDGKRISYTSTDDSGESLVAGDLKGGPVTTLIKPTDRKKMGGFSWLRDGWFIYTDPCDFARMGPDSPCNYWINRLDSCTGELLDKPRRLTNWFGAWIGGPSLTADGRRAAFLQLSGRGSSYMADLEAGGARLVNLRVFNLEAGGADGINDWGADSKTVIVSQSRLGNYTIRKQPLNSEVQEPIVTSSPGGLEDAMLSPDGKWVIVQVQSDAPDLHANLLRISIAGGTPELIFTIPLWGSTQCARHPSTLCAVAEQTEDRKQMTITSFDPVNGRGAELAKLDLSPAFAISYMPPLWSISPDGSRLAVARGPKDPIEIRSLRGSPIQIVHPKGVNKLRAIVWEADGKGFFVTNITSPGSELLHMDLQGNTQSLWKCNSDRCFGGPSPDGRHLAIYDWKVNANIWMMENF